MSGLYTTDCMTGKLLIFSLLGLEFTNPCMGILRLKHDLLKFKF